VVGTIGRISNLQMLKKFLNISRKYSKNIPYDEKITTKIQTEIPEIFKKYMNGEELTRQEEVEYQSTLNRAVYTSRREEIQNDFSSSTSNAEKETKKKKQIHPHTGQELPDDFEFVKY
jgi:tRNA(His) 5'-end guanylyltransferase